jgi:2-haloacid dehalogenase
MQQDSRHVPRVVVFDLGGVLFDWNPEHLYGRLIPDPAQRHRFLTEVCSRDWHALQDAGDDPVAQTAALQAKFPAQAGLIAAWYDRFDEMLAPPYPEMVALVGRLQAAGVKLHLLSNAPGFMTEWLTSGRLSAAHAFLAAFDAIVVSGTVGCSKPDRAIYDLTAARGGFAPGEAVFLDDTLPNVEGAQAAGWRAVHHREPAGTIAALRAIGLPA